jgi:hypothetical protein
MSTADLDHQNHLIQLAKGDEPNMSANNPSSKAPGKRSPAVIIAMVPVGAVLGFLGGLLIEIIVGLIAGAVFSAEHPAAFSWSFMGSLPGLGALIGAIATPVLYARSRSRGKAA